MTEWISEVQVIENTGHDEALLQRLSEPWGRYCVQCNGGGYYFDTEEKCWEYIHNRWRKVRRESLYVLIGNFPRTSDEVSANDG